MKPETLEIHGYKKIDDVVKNVETWLAGDPSAILSYSAQARVKRLGQKIAADLSIPFLREGIHHYLSGQTAFPSDAPKFSCGGFRVDTQTGNIVPRGKLLFRCCVNFLLLWLATLGAWLVALIREARRGPCVILTGVPQSDLNFEGSDGRFAQFCRDGPLTPLRDAEWMVVQATQPINATCPETIRYARFPLLTLWSLSRIGTKQSLLFLKLHARVFVAFFYAVMRQRINCLLWRDCAEHSAAATLNAAGLIDGVVITNSNWLQQLLWMSDLPGRKFHAYLALYSLNNHAIVYKQDPVAYTHPGLKRLRVDEIWIWNEGYKDILIKEGIRTSCRVVGPILWYLPEPAATSAQHLPTICVFDVSPRSSVHSTAAGSYLNYYNVGQAIQFIDDILYARDKVAAELGIEIKVLLKHKRSPGLAHDAQYFKHLDELAGKGRLTMAASSSNLYSLITNSALMIAPPYSSPVYLAEFLSVTGIFYDGSENVLPTYVQSERVRFVNNREQLIDSIRMAVADSLKPPTAKPAHTRKLNTQ